MPDIWKNWIQIRQTSFHIRKLFVCKHIWIEQGIFPDKCQPNWSDDNIKTVFCWISRKPDPDQVFFSNISRWKMELTEKNSAESVPLFRRRYGFIQTRNIVLLCYRDDHNCQFYFTFWQTIWISTSIFFAFPVLWLFVRTIIYFNLSAKMW